MSGNNEGNNPIRRPLGGGRQQQAQQLFLPSGQTLTVLPGQQAAAAAQLFCKIMGKTCICFSQSVVL